ncbi:Maltose permease [Paramyrothecium foliicola]|nr:Maltose permease [Paramyrothecium foliicola]
MATKHANRDHGGTQHIEQSVRHLGDCSNDHGAGDDWDRIRADASWATEDEHATNFLQAAKRYRKAVWWSAVISLCIIMDGYDTALMGSLFGFPAFQKKYGHEIGDTGKYNLAAPWQMALGMASPLGNVIGITLNGFLTDHFGHKIVLQIGLLSLSCLIFIQFSAPNVQTLLVGQLLCGIPWGIFTTMAPAFASEVAPLVLRSYLETWVVCCWGIGQFFSYAVLFTLNDWDSQWAYRIPFALQWIWPVLITPLAIICPESPWWLVRKGRYAKAEQNVLRLMSQSEEENVQEQAKKSVALMIRTNELEKEINQDTSYVACFQGTDLWRTEIAATAWGSQILTGFAIQGYATYFFQQAGLSANDSFKMTLGIGAIHLVCNLSSAVLSGNYGRRRLFLCGCASLAVFMFLIGFLALGPHNSTFGFATSAVYLAWFGIWCLTLGPLPYIINGEVSSTRLRAKTIVIARGTYLVLNIINSVVTPYILNPEWANWRGKTGHLTGTLTVISFIWAYFRLPETRGRTYEELDVLFADSHMTARKFSNAKIEWNGDIASVVYPS